MIILIMKCLVDSNRIISVKHDKTEIHTFSSYKITFCRTRHIVPSSNNHECKLSSYFYTRRDIYREVYIVLGTDLPKGHLGAT